MTVAILLITAALLSLILILSIAVSRGLQVSRRGLSKPEVVPIDIEAFRNLIDPAEDLYLRRKLSIVDLRTVRRERLRAMAAYVRAAGRNAEILIRIGQEALADPRTSDAARELVNNALLLRRNAVLALFRIYLAWAWPGSGAVAAPLLDRYLQLNGAAMLLGRLQNPASPVRI